MKLPLTLFFILAAAVISGAQDQKAAAHFKQLLADAADGDASAQNDLGIAYSEGNGTRRNQTQAVYWFRKSAEQGHVYGTCNLGLHYSKGWGVPRNPVLMMKYAFAANALDGLACNPAEFIYSAKPKPTQCQIQKGSDLAVAWLRAHPNFKNDHDERPWFGEGKYPITVREQGGSVQLPRNRRRKCR